MSDVGATAAGGTGERLAELIRAQSEAFERAAERPVEHVAAQVRRRGGFTNEGMAASGHRVILDEPVEFGGGGAAPDPAEAMLIAIGASLSVTLTVHAALAGIVLDEVEVALSGALDPARFFRPSSAAGGGIYDLKLSVGLAAREGEAALAAILNRAVQACPVLRSIDARPAIELSLREPA